MKNIAYYIISALVILTSFSMTSCLNDSQEMTIITYDDCAITSFSLGTLNIIVNDSTKKTYSGSTYKFSIDPYNHHIENEGEWLEVKTDPKSITCNVTTKNGGYVFKELSDTAAIIFNSGDTLDFSQGDRELIVVSSNGMNKQTYTIKVNIREDQDEQTTWYDAVKTADLTGEEKAFADSVLAPRETIYDTLTVIGKPYGKTYAISNNTKTLYHIDSQTLQPVKEEMMPGTEKPASNIFAIAAPTGKKATTIVAKNTDGKNIAIYKAEAEGEKWMQLSNEYNKNIPDSTSAMVVSYGTYLLAYASNNRFYLSNDYGRCWEERYFMYSTEVLNDEKAIAFANDKNNILWIFTESGYAYRCKQNGIAWNNK